MLWVNQSAVSVGLSSTAAADILTLQGVGINEVDGAGDADANTHLTHVPKTLRQPWWKAHYVVLATRQSQKSQGQHEFEGEA